MNQDKYVFAQLIEFLDNDKFRRIVAKYSGDRYVKHFTCWNQLLVMMFGQLTNRESLRDLIVIIEAYRNKCYHLGFGKHVTKSNLAKSNQNRDCRIFEEFAYFLVEIVAIVQHDMQLKRSTYEVLQILGVSLTDKTPQYDLFNNNQLNDFKELNNSSGQLLLNF